MTRGMVPAHLVAVDGGSLGSGGGGRGRSDVSGHKLGQVRRQLVTEAHLQWSASLHAMHLASLHCKDFDLEEYCQNQWTQC